MILPSITECLKIISDEALSQARHILKNRSRNVIPGEGGENTDETVTAIIDACIENDDVEGLAAGLLSHRLLQREKPALAGLPQKIANLLVRKADDFRRHHRSAGDVLVLYQLAAGLDPGSVDALLGVVTSLVSREPLKETMALAYAVLLFSLDPAINYVSDILRKTGERETYHAAHAYETAVCSDRTRHEDNARESNSEKSDGAFGRQPNLPLARHWSFYPRGACGAGIAGASGIAVCGSGRGTLYGIRLGDGARCWKYRPDRSPAKSLLANGDRLFARSDGYTVCLLLSNGKEVWKTARDKTKSTPPSPSASALYWGGYLFFRDTSLTVYNALNGKFEGDLNIGAGPTYHAGLCASGAYVFIAAEQKIMVLSLFSGAVIWEIPVSGTITAGPVAAGDHIIIGTDKPSIEALSIETGTRTWQFLPEPHGNGDLSRPVYQAGRIFFGGPGGVVYALRANDGREICRRTAGPALAAPLTLGSGVIAVLLTGGTVALLSPRDLALLQELTVPDFGFSTPDCSLLLSGKCLLVRSNVLHAFCSE
ncbi:MAG: PQQ-binding-like beta-propeller repeat protein [Spirochaetales bacterium]|nr:PQQ-binding-like beta-propeller repeat protein [Spirochaetales bacterium]